MQDFKSINDFRKGYRYSNMAEDPTYLSFFFMFDYYSEESPLFNGEALNYLRNVIQDEERATSLENFIKILKRVNSELPWFWQSVSGLDATRKYGKLAEPYWGAGDPALEISCLETVELTTSGMIDLYKRAAFDFDRWVEVLPKNIRRFRMWVWVSEVRDFAVSSAQRFSNGAAQLTGNENLDVFGKDNSVKNVRPFFKVELGYCQFDPDSTDSIFADLSRSPSEPAAPKIKIFFENASYTGEYANNAIKDDRTLGQMIGDVAKEKAGQVVSGAIDRTVDNVIARAPLGNVHGLNLASSIQDAVSTGSINGIANLVGSAVGNGNNSSGPSIGLGEVYDPVPLKNEQPINANAYDSVPGQKPPLNYENVYSGSNIVDNETLESSNVYDTTPTDNDSLGKISVYDRTAPDSEGPLNENAHK